MTPPVQATGSSPLDFVFAAEFGADQEHKINQISGGLAENRNGNRVAGVEPARR